MASLSEISRYSTPPPPTDSASSSTTELTPKKYEVIVRPLPFTPSRVTYPKQQFDWWDDTHHLLFRMGEANQEGIVSKDDVRQITAIAENLMGKGNPIELLMFMNLLSNFIFFDTKVIFFKVLARLRVLEPEINQFFGKIDVEVPEDGPGLTPLAIDSMFRFFEDEFGYKPSLLSCQPVSKLPELVETMIASDIDHLRGWAIHNDEMEDDPHIVPVFSIRIDGITHVFIFDSLGHDISSGRVSASLEKLGDYFGKKDPGGKLAIYSYKIKRQHSPYGCATFSILDVKNLLERHSGDVGTIVDFYTKQADEHKPHRVIYRLKDGTEFPIYEIDILPPEMMKVTQSVRQINAYKSGPPTLSPELMPTFSRYTSSGTIQNELQDIPALDRSVSEISRTAPDEKTRNLYVEQKRFAHIVYLLARYFKTEEATAVVPSRSIRKLALDEMDDEKE